MTTIASTLLPACTTQRLATLAFAALFCSAAAAQQGIGTNSQGTVDASAHDVTSHSSSDPGGTGIICSLINFEGFGDNQQVGVVPGDINVTFGPSWLGLIDQDAGGSGNIANEPSANTVAYFLDPADPIDFDQPVQFVQVSYVASAVSIPVTLTAWDGPFGTGNVVDVATGNTVGTDFDGADCTGDPNGQFCLWDVLTLTASTDTILSITLGGATANQFAFDDMTFCSGDPIERFCFGVQCPCGNDDPLAGCANSTGSGASMTVSGTPSVVADNLVLTVSNAIPGKFGVMYFGGAQACVPFGDGLRAVDPGPPGQFVRLGVQQASATGEMVEGPGIAAQMQLATSNAVNAGETWYFQGYYRDGSGPCGSGFNLSNGVAVTFSL